MRRRSLSLRSVNKWVIATLNPIVLIDEKSKYNTFESHNRGIPNGTNATKTNGVPNAMITIEDDVLNNSIIKSLKDINSVMSVTSMSFENRLRIRPKIQIIVNF